MSEFRIINKTALRDLMEEPPKGQRIFNSLGDDGDFDQLTDSQVINIEDILDNEFKGIKDKLNQVKNERNIS